MLFRSLISTLEPRETGYRVAQVEPADQIFNVADWLFWTDCEDNVIADLFWYDPKDQSIQPLPVPILTIIKNNFRRKRKIEVCQRCIPKASCW